MEWDYRLVPDDIAPDEERQDRWLADLAAKGWLVETGPLHDWDGTAYLLWRHPARHAAAAAAPASFRQRPAR